MNSTTLRVETCGCVSNTKEFGFDAAEHRHGSSLQILASLTRRSLRNAEGEEARAALGFVSELVDTMIALHKIGQVGEGADDPSVLLRGMASKWQQVCEGRIRIVTDLENGLEMPKSSQTIAILIAQELVMNAIENRFADRHDGTIWIRLYSTARNDVTLEVKDDGVGMAASGSETAETAATRHDTTLVRDLAVSLGGTMRDQARRDSGSCIAVSWPV